VVTAGVPSLLPYRAKSSCPNAITLRGCDKGYMSGRYCNNMQLWY